MGLEIEIYMWLDLQTGVLCMHLILQILKGIISLVRKLLWQNFLSYKHNDRKVLTPNFKAINQTHAELHKIGCVDIRISFCKSGHMAI